MSRTECTYDPLPESLLTSAEHASHLGFLDTRQADLTGVFELGPLNTILARRGRPAV